MTNLYHIIKGYFSFSDEGKLKNQVAHFFINHEKAKARIKKAEKTFLKVKEATVKDFQNLKKSTIEKTCVAIDVLKTNVFNEEQENAKKFKEAQDKIDEKKSTLDVLESNINSIASEDHSL